ncbi:MAG: hypothetical protein E5V49_00500 [Mesorhizobium sp.]|nr:hypothetical protein EN848_31110 [bacterium M00.F.Ca.ET.205.01.1.1]TGU46716.1 hypothetical protein EN795_31505 [bacterium M00.F.Ca.ET.152.01.1.1]TGV31813.1 hypothetical protein EN829_031180 [Mesorhizobium sp. M00.F.Ca.ET.186.01.1.1]TGZ38980.1 hypothetical protein EN805_31100 [bacterium M00.F.Ca.ET.162.01.1.1]TIW63077.1 MAG: hypothetical protein E5V48_00890 [Mesorhizobium sp.]
MRNKRTKAVITTIIDEFSIKKARPGKVAGPLLDAGGDIIAGVVPTFFQTLVSPSGNPQEATRQGAQKLQKIKILIAGTGALDQR